MNVAAISIPSSVTVTKPYWSTVVVPEAGYGPADHGPPFWLEALCQGAAPNTIRPPGLLEPLSPYRPCMSPESMITRLPEAAMKLAISVRSVVKPDHSSSPATAEPIQGTSATQKMIFSVALVIWSLNHCFWVAPIMVLELSSVFV